MPVAVRAWARTCDDAPHRVPVRRMTHDLDPRPPSPVQGDEGAAGRSPRHRPPLWLRMVVGVSGLAVGASTAGIMLSDRAPGVLRRLSAGFVERVSEQIDTPGPRRFTDDPRVPDGDLMVHITLWALATVLVGWSVWSWRGLAAGAAGVLTLSFAVEFAQERVTDTRVFEVGDLVANTVGVALGAAVAAGSYVLVDLVVGRRRRHSGRRRPPSAG